VVISKGFLSLPGGYLRVNCSAHFYCSITFPRCFRY